MKKLTCKDLGGPCDHVFESETFEEMAELCKAHVMEMIAAGDAPHQDAVNAMMSMAPEQQQVEFLKYKERFEAA